ncbi:carbohydrate ABC transporter permease [Alkalithermobacter paradoxus]|uniref:Maltose transport system permease protein MalF n=1 Tax=Alkalithermobacter paradoxus TaxID=29349 RepID=A0A1V4I573_9FIRM|nr:maltose transport system permease protein MalF [[Clostridium] thermoalcaliphilum]
MVKKDNKLAYLYLIPAFLIVMIISFGPILYGIGLSFLNVNLYTMGEDNRIKEIQGNIENTVNIINAAKKQDRLDLVSKYEEKLKIYEEQRDNLTKSKIQTVKSSIASLENEIKNLEPNKEDPKVNARIIERQIQIEGYKNELEYLNERLENKEFYKPIKFVGLRNYKRSLQSLNSEFVKVLYRTVIWTIINVFFHVTIGIFLALLLNREDLKLKGLYRTILILPWAVPQFITALIWKILYHSQFGFINKLLNVVGIPSIPWLVNERWAFVAVIITNIWLGFPFMILVATGALQSISKSLYEAADIDGATTLQKLRLITLPLIKPTMIPATILGTIWTFTNFNVVYLITGGGPNKSTELIATYQYNALVGGNYSLAATYSVITFIILAIFTTINTKVSKAFDE